MTQRTATKDTSPTTSRAACAVPPAAAYASRRVDAAADITQRTAGLAPATRSPTTNRAGRAIPSAAAEAGRTVEGAAVVVGSRGNAARSQPPRPRTAALLRDIAARRSVPIRPSAHAKRVLA